LRHEQLADRIVPGLWQLESKPHRLSTKKIMWNLHQYTGAITHQRIGADGSTVLEVFEYVQRIGDEGMTFAAFEIDDKADTASVVLTGWIVKALRAGHARAALGKLVIQIRIIE
jgi:hypothetical protein